MVYALVLDCTKLISEQLSTYFSYDVSAKFSEFDDNIRFFFFYSCLGQASLSTISYRRIPKRMTKCGPQKKMDNQRNFKLSKTRKNFNFQDLQDSFLSCHGDGVGFHRRNINGREMSSLR